MEENYEDTQTEFHVNFKKMNEWSAHPTHSLINDKSSMNSTTRSCSNPFRECTNMMVVPTNLTKVKTHSNKSIKEDEKEIEADVDVIQFEPIKTGKTEKKEKRRSSRSSVEKQKKKTIISTPDSICAYDFMLRQIPQDEIIKLSIFRKKLTLNQWINIHFQGTDKPLFCYKKNWKMFGHKVTIGLPVATKVTENSQIVGFNEKTAPHSELGVLESNLNGSVFNLFHTIDNNRKEIMATFHYKTSMRGNVFRQVDIYIKKDIQAKMEGLGNLRELWKSGGQNSGVQVLSTLEPNFDEEHKIYSARFGAKVSVISSIHNMMIINSDKSAGLKLYKTGADQFQMECSNPLNPLIGSAFAVSSFLFKLSTQ